MSSEKLNQVSPWKIIVASCLASNFAEFATLPFDTAKVRLQLYPQKYTSLVQTLKLITQEEGFTSLFNGLKGGFLRQTVFGTCRMTFYDSGRQYLVRKKGEENINFLDKVALGIITGGLAISIANPADTIKVRFQTDSSKNPRYKGLLDAGLKIYKTEGMKGFYQSLPANIGRNSIMNTAELASYDQIKSSLLNSGMMSNGFPLFLASSFGAGLIAVTVGSPLDVLKSQIIEGKMLEDGSKIPYKNMRVAVADIYSRGGLSSFYKGFTANCQRVVSWNVLMFMTKEKVLSYLNNKGDK